MCLNGQMLFSSIKPLNHFTLWSVSQTAELVLCVCVCVYVYIPNCLYVSFD